jgi:hypothetical protein
MAGQQSPPQTTKENDMKKTTTNIMTPTTETWKRQVWVTDRRTGELVMESERVEQRADIPTLTTTWR